MAFSRKVLAGTFFLLSLASLSAAQSPTPTLSTSTTGSSPSASPEAPACAVPCIQTATLTQSCAPGDQACLCSFSTQIQESVYKCLQQASCSDSDEVAAFQYYPAFCQSLHLVIETDLPTMIPSSARAGLTAVPTGSHQASEGATGTPDSDKNIHAGLQLPAILGIVLLLVLMFTAVGAMMIWSFIRRRQMARRPRMDLAGEFVDTKSHSSRNKSTNGDYAMRDEFGRSLSGTSTLVAPSPVAKQDGRSSAEQRESFRNKTLRALLGSDGQRTSFLSSRPVSEHPSLMVTPLDVRRSQENRLRVDTKI